jgi:predicted DNA binding CopG/RHH family protein
MEFEWDASKDADNGENSGGCTMRKPSIRDVKADIAGTRRLRAEMATTRSVKITINVDADSLAKLKILSAESGVPYQRLLNRILKERLAAADTLGSRLDRIERELARVKKTLAA